MIFNELVQNLQLYFLIFARIFALFSVIPIISSTGVSSMIRAGLTLFTAVAVYPMVSTLGYVIPEEALLYGFLFISEVLTGLLIGLFIQIVFTIFQLSGQLFSVQMGFGASSTYDPLSQIEMPLVGQLFNILGLFVFLVSGSLRNVFLIGVYQSFQALRGEYLLMNPTFLSTSLISALGQLFEQSMLMAFPMIGTLFMVSVTMGLLAKASPQMNLMMVGFPIQISVGFLIIMMASPFIIEKMNFVLEMGFDQIEALIKNYHVEIIGP